MDGLSFSRRKIWLACDRGTLVSGFVNILVYLTNTANNFEIARRIFSNKKVEILEISCRFISLFIWPLGFKIIDNL